MRRAIDLAHLGLGTTYPNPLVGAVLVHESRIIGEGWHQKAGEAHAEVRCFDSVVSQDKKFISESTLYVTLEPCDHYGRTSPCSLRVIEERVSKVVIGTKDPNPAVGGKGIERIKEAGISVEIGVCEEEARWMNRRYLTSRELGRPYVVLKWAASADGYIDPGSNHQRTGPVWITGKRTKQVVHQWRAEEQAILVGRITAEIDDPGLDVREVDGKNPIRMVIDPDSQLPGHLQMWNKEGETWTFGHKVGHPYSDRHFELEWDETSVHSLLEKAHLEGIQSILVEGGAQTLAYFIERDLWDEARIFTGTKTFGSGIEAPRISGVHMERTMVDQDQLDLLKNLH